MWQKKLDEKREIMGHNYNKIKFLKDDYYDTF